MVLLLYFIYTWQVCVAGARQRRGERRVLEGMACTTESSRGEKVCFCVCNDRRNPIGEMMNVAPTARNTLRVRFQWRPYSSVIIL